MKLSAIVFLTGVSSLILSACNSSSQPPPVAQPGNSSSSSISPAIAPPTDDTSVASVNGVTITNTQLQDALVDSYGLNILIELVQRDLARQEAALQNITVTSDDIQSEADKTLVEYRNYINSQTNQPTTEPDGPITPEEREKLLNLFVGTERITRPEFQITIETNAILRKMVASTAAEQLTEDNIRERFNVLYGEKAQVRWIRANTIMDVSHIEGELKDGHSFEELVRLHSFDGEGTPSSGETQPFSRKETQYPPEFRMAAFDLKPGQISDPVQVQDAYYLIQLVDLIPPQNAKYEDYHDSVKADLFDQTVGVLMKAEREKLGLTVLHGMEIDNPVLRQQWEAKLAEKDKELKTANDLKVQFEKQQQELTTLPATQP